MIASVAVEHDLTLVTHFRAPMIAVSSAENG
jgi:hypothetical protein